MALVVLAVLLVGALLFLGLPFRRSGPASSSLAVVYAPSSGLKQLGGGGLKIRSMTSSDPQPKVEKFYQMRLGLQNTRLGAQSKHSLLGGRESSGVVDFKVQDHAVLALSRLRETEFAAVLIEPASRSNLVQIFLIERAFDVPSNPILTSEIPNYPAVDGPFGSSSPDYRGFTFETPDAVEAVADFYRTNLAGWQLVPEATVPVSDGIFLLATKPNRVFFLRALRSTNENLTRVLFVIAGK